MKTLSKILAGLLIIAVSFISESCQTFMPSNILDESAKVKAWLLVAGYQPKTNGYDIYKLDNQDKTKTFVKSYDYGFSDDKIAGTNQLADRIKFVNDKVRFECTVSKSNDYYLLRVSKSFLVTDLSVNDRLLVENWKVPFIAEVYLRIPEIDKDSFVNAVKRLESDFSMNYAEFIDYHEQMLIDIEMENQLDEEHTEQDSVQADPF